MVVTVSGGWTPDKGANELDAQIKFVGNDPGDVLHLESLLADDWKVARVVFEGGALLIEVKASRKLTLEEQAEQKKVGEEAAKADAAAKDEHQA